MYFFALFFVDFLYMSTSFFSGDRSSLLCRCVWFEMFFPDCSCLLYNMSYAGDIVDLIVSPLDTGQQTWTPNFQSFFPEKILSPALVTSSGMCRGKLTEGKFGPVGQKSFVEPGKQAAYMVLWLGFAFHFLFLFGVVFRHISVSSPQRMKGITGEHSCSLDSLK